MSERSQAAQWGLVLLAVVACRTRDGEANETPSTQESQKHARDEVRLTAEGAERAGIHTAKVERRAIGGGVGIPAEIQFEPTSTARVGSLVAGRFTKISVSMGDHVMRRQLLATVASSDVSAARSRLEQAQARLAAAETTLKRQQQLSQEGIGAQRALVEAEAQVGELRAEVEGVKRQLSVFGSGGSGELQLFSPIDGVVVEIRAALGATAAPDEAAFVVTDPTKVWVRGNVPELELSKVQVGGGALVRLHAFPTLALAGTVTYVAPALDESTRSLPIRVTLDAPDSRLRSGLFGSIELLGGARDERVLVVPVDAVTTLDGQDAVFTPGEAPNTFRSRPVELGRRAGSLLEVRKGLSEGDVIVAGNAFTLKSVLKSAELSEE